MESWSRAVLEWVNCLDILESNVNDLKELRDGRFYAKLIKILSKEDSEDYQDDKDFVFTFIKDTYPEFLGEGKESEKKCKEIHIASLLLLHSSQEPKLHRPMCIKLSNETQIKIKSFLEKVLEYGSRVTKDNISTAIIETAENLIRTPPVTPKMRPLKDFFNSPATTVRKNYNKMMDERTREVRALKADLETERFEKADLQEDLEIQRQKNHSLQQKLQEKIAEMKKMREDSTRFETPQSAKKKRDGQTPRNRVTVKVQELSDEIALLKTEMNNLQDEKKSLMRKLASAERNCATYKERSKMNERNLETLLIQADIKDQELEELKNHNEQLRSHIQEIRRQTIAEQSFEMEMTALSPSNRSLNHSEVLSSVIDIQLQEAKEESKVFKCQVEDLNRRLESVQRDYQVLEKSNMTLEAEVVLFQSTKQELSDVQEKLSRYIELSNTLEKDKTHFETLVLKKERLLKQSEQQNETLQIHLHDLKDKLNTANDLLSKETSRVKSLETMVSQKVEALQAEHLRYEDLDQKYSKLKQETLDMLEKTKDLKSLVSSREDSLSQARQQIKSLELDLCNLKGGLKDVQDLLSTEKTRVQDLESFISDMKLKHEQILEAESLRYQSLEQKSANLEKEKVSLLREMEDLNLKMAENKDLLKESREKNQDLAIDLRDLNEKLRIAQYELAEERKRVEDLESTVSRVETDKREFIASQISKYQALEEKYVNLEAEKLSFVKDIDNLNSAVLSKEKLLKQCLKEKENLELTLSNVNEKVVVIQESLDKEKTRSKDLESTVTVIKQENEEALKNQILRYDDLDKLHINAEQEKLKLITEVDRLNSLILNKEKLLEQSQQQNGKIKVDLCDLEMNLQSVQELLSAEKTRVNDLESVVSQTKLEHEEIVEEQTSRYKDLEEKYVNLEQEKVKLFQETENLNHKIAENQSLLAQSQQEKQRLISELEDLNDELQSLKVLLAEERSKVENLESTITQVNREQGEVLEKQLASYQVLEKKHTDVEKAKLGLMTESENLKNLLLSKEELIQQLQLDIRKLQSDLCKAKDELNKEMTKVKSLECALAERNIETDKILQSNENLQAEISLLKSDQQDLYEVKEQLHEQTEELEQQKSRLLKEVEELKAQDVTKEESLKQTQDQNVILHSKLGVLEGEVKSVQNLLSMESGKVKDLESTITRIEHKSEEALESEFMRYQTLEKKHTDVKQEKLDLLKNTENLENLLLSKGELLQQSEKHGAKLERALCEMKNEMKTVQDELDAATTKVKNLESALTESKLEIDKIVQSNENLCSEMSLLKSDQHDLYEAKEQLHKRSEELEQAKSHLLGKIEELKMHISSKEDLLKQTQQQNEVLHSKLKDLDEEAKSVQNLLSVEKIRVEDLESTIIQIKQENELTLQSELTRYQVLEKKYADIEEEKLNLLKDTEKFENLLLSKEELLQQSQKHSANLADALRDMKNEMKSVQNELDAATTKVKSLESGLTETKLETDKIVQSNKDLLAEMNLLKSAKKDLCELKEQLQKHNEELEQGKLRLLEEIEEFKLQVSSKEDLLRQTQQQNEDLHLKMKNLDDEVKSERNLLNKQNTRVEDLESIVMEAESERKESLDIIERLKSENAEHRNLIQNCTSILTELVKHSSKLTGNKITDVGDSTILDLSKQLKTSINSLEVIYSSKDSDLKNFEATVSTLNLTVAQLKTEMKHFEEIKVKADQVISEYLKEISDLRVIAKEKNVLLEDMDKLQKQLSAEKSKVNLLEEEKKLLGQNLGDVRQSLLLLRSERSILVENVKNQNRDLLSKMASISEVIVKMQGRIQFDNDTLEHLREEKTLSVSKYEQEKELRMDLESKCETLENENKSQTKEKKELKDKLNAIRVRNAKLEKNLDELRKENKKLENKEQPAAEDSKLEELNASISKMQLQIQELEAEKIELCKRPTTQEFDARLKEVHVEYDQKLEKIKQKMKTAYNEQIAKVNRDQERLMQEKLNAQRVKLEEQCRKHGEEITKYKDHVTKLSSDYWDVGEKLLVEKQQKENIAQQLQDLKMRYQYERTTAANNLAMSQPSSNARSKTSSLDRREFVSTVRDEASTLRTVQTIKEEVMPSARRESIQSLHTLQGMGNAFKAEDEEGEVFNTNYLADMKAGRCSIAPDLERLSVLQMRNARCKPHLKSSYPAETQFQPGTFTEEEIKSGNVVEDVFNDSLSQSLLPGEKTKKRDRTQTLYKRPGPPTPSKNGGRLSLQGNESRSSPNSRVLRERNVERRSTATPRRLKDLFGGSSRRQDENVSGTPKGRRLSSIFRKPK